MKARPVARCEVCHTDAQLIFLLAEAPRLVREPPGCARAAEVEADLVQRPLGPRRHLSDERRVLVARWVELIELELMHLRDGWGVHARLAHAASPGAHR